MDRGQAWDPADAGTPAGNAGSQPAPTWAASFPETRYAKSEDGYVAYQSSAEAPTTSCSSGTGRATSR